MRVNEITTLHSLKTKAINNKHNNTSQTVSTNLTDLSKMPVYYAPSFGYCTPHMRMMKNTNEKFQSTINSLFESRDAFLANLQKRQAKIDKNSEINKLAAQVIAQYSNYQYSMAEVIPSYAMESAPELMAALNNTQVFSNPVDILITIKDTQNLQTKEGIDQYTGKPYTDEQMRKSKANTQLYSTVLLVEMLDKNIDKATDEEAKKRIVELKASVLDSISEIYGADAYERIQTLKKMGADASLEDKRKSLDLVKEFDEKAKELKLRPDFEEKLDELIAYVNEKENRTFETEKVAQKKIPLVTLKYHTHPQTENHHDHDHYHDHDAHHEHEHEHKLTHEEMHRRGIAHKH